MAAFFAVAADEFRTAFFAGFLADFPAAALAGFFLAARLGVVTRFLRRRGSVTGGTIKGSATIPSPASGTEAAVRSVALDGGSAFRASLAASAAVIATSRTVSANLSMIVLSFAMVPPACLLGTNHAEGIGFPAMKPGRVSTAQSAS